MSTRLMTLYRLVEGTSIRQVYDYLGEGALGLDPSVEILEVAQAPAVLVHAAGSGVGVAAVQIAKLHGARVIATAGSDAKLARARALGADHLLNHAREDVPRAVRALTSGRNAGATGVLTLTAAPSPVARAKRRSA